MNKTVFFALFASFFLLTFWLIKVVVTKSEYDTMTKTQYSKVDVVINYLCKEKVIKREFRIESDSIEIIPLRVSDYVLPVSLSNYGAFLCEKRKYDTEKCETILDSLTQIELAIKEQSQFPKWKKLKKFSTSENSNINVVFQDFHENIVSCQVYLFEDENIELPNFGDRIFYQGEAIIYTFIFDEENNIKDVIYDIAIYN